MKFFKKENEDATYVLDVKGYVCPQPQLFTAKSLKKMPEGAILEVITDNPSSVESVKEICRGRGFEIIEIIGPEGGITTIRIQN